ncbi:MAG TPA: O-antigen ligase family protein [Bdellovibrionota bacterium]
MNVGSAHVKIHQILFFLSFGLAVWAWRKRLREAVARLRNPFFHCFLGLTVFYAFSVLWSFYPAKTFFYSGWLFFNLFTIYGSARLNGEFLTAERWLLLIRVTMGAMAGIILIDHLAYSRGFPDGLIGFNHDTYLKWGVSRAHAFSGEPSYIGLFLATALVASSTVFSRKIDWRFLLLDLGVLLAIIATVSRSSWVALAIGLGLAVLWKVQVQKRMPWKGLGIGAGLLCLLGLGIFFALSPAQKASFDKNLFGSLIRGEDGSANARWNSQIFAFEMAKETRGMGTGLGASYVYWTRSHPDGNNNVRPPDPMFRREAVMSTWGQLLAEGGVVAVLLYGAAAILLLRALRQRAAAKRDPQLGQALASALLFFVIGAWMLGNVARGDVWVWYSYWSALAFGAMKRA